MSEHVPLFALDSQPPALGPDPIRIAHYSGYPRVSKDHRVRMAIAQANHGSSLALIASDSEDVGALLRLNVSDLTGPPASETLARVISCSPREDGRFELVLETLRSQAPRFVRRKPEALRIEG